MSKLLRYTFAISFAICSLSFFIFATTFKGAWSQDESRMEIIIKNLKDKDSNVRVKAAHALLKMGPEAKEAVPALIEALEDEDDTVRWYTAETLERLNTLEAQKALEEYKKKAK